jgi:tetratricopeptide (TPR) repeat protein
MKRCWIVAVVLLVAASTAAASPQGPSQSDLSRCENGSGEEAIQACTMLLSLGGFSDTQLAMIYRLRGFRLRDLGNYKQAIADHSEAIKLDPAFAPAWNSRCWARGTGNIEIQEGLADCNEAIRLRPDYFHYHNSRGLIFLRQGRLDDAIAEFTVALRGQPEHAESLFLRGVARRQKGDAAAGDEDIAKARRFQSDIAEKFARDGIK